MDNSNETKKNATKRENFANFLKAAEAGDAEATRIVGDCCRYGFYVEKDASQSVEGDWYSRESRRCFVLASFTETESASKRTSVGPTFGSAARKKKKRTTSSNFSVSTKISAEPSTKKEKDERGSTDESATFARLTARFNVAFRQGR
jgi:hypothetical protein